MSYRRDECDVEPSGLWGALEGDNLLMTLFSKVKHLMLFSQNLTDYYYFIYFKCTFYSTKTYITMMLSDSEIMAMTLRARNRRYAYEK